MMKVGGNDPILVQRQYRVAQPFLKEMQYFDPLGDIIRRMREERQEKRSEYRNIRARKIDLQA